MFDSNKEYVLENDRIKLIPLKQEHLNDLLPFALNEPGLWEYSLTPGDGIENMTKYVAKAVADRESGTSYPFVVFDKKFNTIIGSTRFYDIQPHHKTTQLGFTWYGSKYHGTGANKSCKYLLLDFAFEIMQVKRVEFRADAKNAQSIAAMKSLGCVPEGILRSNCASETGRRDSIILSILQSEWTFSVREHLLSRI